MNVDDTVTAEPDGRRTSITVSSETLSRLKKYQARLIGEREDPNLSVDDAVDGLLSHIESCGKPPVVQQRRGVNRP